MPWDADNSGMKDEPLEDLEYALRERAFAFDAELVVDTMPDSRLRAAFKSSWTRSRSGSDRRA